MTLTSPLAVCAAPTTIASPPFLALLNAAFKAHERPAWPQAGLIAAELAHMVHTRDASVVVALDGDRLCGLLVVIFPSSPLAAGPFVYISYGETLNASRAVALKAVDLLRERGYYEIRSTNTLLDDETYQRVFRDVGTPVREGTVFKWRLNGPEGH